MKKSNFKSMMSSFGVYPLKVLLAEYSGETSGMSCNKINSISSLTPIKNSNQINDNILKNVVQKIDSDFQNPVEFLKENFPNFDKEGSLKLVTSIDYLGAATLLLIFASFSKEAELEKIREIMCSQLDNATQLNIAEFLMNIQEHDDVFNLSFKKIKQEICSINERNPTQNIIGDGLNTPIKSNVSNNSFGSPLQGFFQTPKRSAGRKFNTSSTMCGDGDHLKLIKKLTNQLVEEEQEKASLQEQLNSQTQKCNEFEIKLKNKIEEINLLKSEWENETKKNEVEFKSLKNNLMKKMEDEKKLKNEINDLETYITILESDLSKSVSEKDKLEFQLKTALDKCMLHEPNLKELTELNIQLRKLIENKEKELTQLKEEFMKNYKEDKSIDLSYIDGSFDRSLQSPENMGVVIDKLLEEKKEENIALKETIEELQKEKNNLCNEIQSINEQLNIKSSTISELEFLTKELGVKVEIFESTEKELIELRKELNEANSEISKLMKENSYLNEKFNALNTSLQEREQDLINCKNSKMLLHMNYIKLAQDFKTVHRRLDAEIKNISNLTCETKENFFKKEKSFSLPDVEEENFDEIKDSETTNFSQVPSEEKIEKEYQSFENRQIDWSESKISMQATCNQLNDSLIILKMKISELEDSKKKTFSEKKKLEQKLQKVESKILEKDSIYNFEITKLKKDLEVKENEVKNLKEEMNDKIRKIKELQEMIFEIQKANENLIVKNEALMKEAKREDFRFVYEGGDFKKPEKVQESQDLSDSLEEVPVCNKTFDIVNLEERNMSDRTFSIKKEEDNNRYSRGNSTWIVSPPSKVPTKPKEPVRRNTKRNGDSWIVPIVPKLKEKTKKISSSNNDLSLKTETKKISSFSNLTKSSSLSSILEIDFSPPKIETKSSTSCVSLGTTTVIKEEAKETSTEIPEPSIENTKFFERSPVKNFRLTERNDNPLSNVFQRNSIRDESEKLEFEAKICELQKELAEFSKECDRLRAVLLESEHKRKKDKEIFEKNQEIIRKNIAAKYESQLEHLKNEMKLLHNRELAKHKAEQSKLNSELRDQNKRYKEHIDELRNQLWDLGEKLLQEQKLRRDLERMYNELKKKFENISFFRDPDSKSLNGNEIFHSKDSSLRDEKFRLSGFNQIPNTAFPTMPTEDEDEIFDNRFLEDMKMGLCKAERPEGRLMELQYRNSLCLPHLKSSYPGETQFHNPTLFKENDLKLGLLQFGQESQSLTDSDHSMTKSLIPDNKPKKKEQPSYKRPGPPTPSKNGGRLSLQSGDFRMTPRNALRELNDQTERTKLTPNPLKNLLLSKSLKAASLGSKDENAAPVITPRKKSKFFRKPFGARDH